MELEFWATTDVGRVRDHNEDNFLVDKRMKLFVVCDGMGGHAAGEVASAMSVRVVREVLSSHREVFDRLEKDPESLANRKSVLALVEHSIQEACARVFHAAQEDSSQRGMGTTCSLLLLAEGRGFIGHVGDSRIYLYRQEQIHQITEDHSLINEMIRLGKIKPGEEVNLPHKNAVTRAVGVNEFVEVDTFELDVFGGDSFLVCSDGLSGYFSSDSQIADLLEQEDVKKITEDCIDYANAGGGKDNITSIVVRVTSDSQQTLDIQRTMEVMRTTPYFQYLGYKEMVQMVNLSKRRELSAHDVVFGPEDDPGGMFLVVRGEISLRRDGKSVKKLVFGDHFGEVSLIDETPRQLEAIAKTDSVVLYFPRERFMGLLRQEPNLAVKLLWNFLQTFTIRTRDVPYEMLIGGADIELDEHTPPSGTLTFEQDMRLESGHKPASISGEFVTPQAEEMTADAADTTRKADPIAPATKKTRPVSRKPAGTKKDDVPKPQPTGKLAASDSTVKTNPVVKHEPVRNGAPTIQNKSGAGGAQMQSMGDPDATVDLSFDDGGGMAWDDIVPGDLLEDEESLRRTIQMDQEPEERRLSIPTANPAPPSSETVDAEDFRETIPSSANNRLGKPISGESVTKNATPQAQVLKRTKLVVGERNNFEESEHTSDVKPLKKRKSDSTLELDIEDDGVEEIT